MSMSLDAAYRLITVRLSTANDPIQPIRLAGGDIAGRVLRVEYPAEGLGELGQNEARLAYNPNPDGDASGGYVTASEVGITTSGRYAIFRLPRNVFKTTHAVLAFELVDDDTVISSRRIPVIVEKPVVNTEGGVAYDGLSDLHNAVSIAENAATLASNAENTFNAAVNSGREQIKQLLDTANIDCAEPTALNPNQNPTAMLEPDSTGLVKTLKLGLPRAPQFHTPKFQALTPNDASSASVLLEQDSDDGNYDVSFSLPRPADIVDVTAKAGERASVEKTLDKNGDVKLAFTLPRGRGISQVVTHTVENDDDVSVRMAADNDSDWTVDLGLPKGPKGDKGDTGEQGEKGDPGDAGAIATFSTAGCVKPGGDLTVDSDGTLHSYNLQLVYAKVGSDTAWLCAAVPVYQSVTHWSSSYGFGGFGIVYLSQQVTASRLVLGFDALPELPGSFTMNSLQVGFVNVASGEATPLTGTSPQVAGAWITLTVADAPTLEAGFYWLRTLGVDGTYASSDAATEDAVSMADRGISQSEITAGFAAAGYTVSFDADGVPTCSKQVEPTVEPGGGLS